MVLSNGLKMVLFTPIPLETMTISLYGSPEGSLLEIYTILKTGERDMGATLVFTGMIPGSILPAGDVMQVQFFQYQVMHHFKASFR